MPRFLIVIAEHSFPLAAGLLAEAGAETDDLAHRGIAGCGCIIALGDAFVYLTQRGEGRNPGRHRLDVELLRDRQGPHLDELARLRPHDGRAEDAAALG